MKSITAEKTLSNKDSSGIRKWDDINHSVEHGHSRDGEVVDTVEDVKFPEEITNATLAQQHVKNKTEVHSFLGNNTFLIILLTIIIM